jgi:hypothetical protein
MPALPQPPGDASVTPENVITWAEFPQRRCRDSFMVTEHVDHSCDLPEHHPGPHASKGSALSQERSLAWQAAHPGWEQLMRDDDPFREVKP